MKEIVEVVLKALPAISKAQSQRFIITAGSIYCFWRSGTSPWCAVVVAGIYVASVTIEKTFKKHE